MDCIEEIVADSMFDVFSDRKTVQKLAKENMTLTQKIRSVLDRTLSCIEKGLKALSLSGKAEEVKALIDEKDKLAHIRELMAEGLEQAKKNRAEQTAGQKNNTAEAVKKSVKKSIVDLSTDNKLSEKIKNLHGSERYKIIRDYILETLENQSVQMSDGKTAVVDRSDALHIANKSGEEKATQISKIKELIEKALFYAEDNNVEHPKFNYFCYYKADVKYKEDVYSVYLNVGKGKNDGKYHIYDITKK